MSSQPRDDASHPPLQPQQPPPPLGHQSSTLELGGSGGGTLPPYLAAAGADEHHVSELADDDDDVVEESPDSVLTLWLCGTGAKLWQFIRYELGIASMSVALSLLAAIVGSSCGPTSCLLFTIPVSRWMFFLAFSVVISIPGRVLDRAFFSSVAAAGQIITFSFLLPVFFYTGAFEGSISRYFWFTLTWSLSDNLLRLQDPTAIFVFEGVMRSLLVYQLLATARNVALRVLMRTVLIGSFEGKINDVLFQNLVLLLVSKEHACVTPEGRLVLEKDAAYREMARTYGASDFRRKLDYISKQRFRMYNKAGDLIAVGKKEAVSPFAKLAFKRLSRIPASALIELDNKAEEITAGVGISMALPNTPLGGGGGAAPDDGSGAGALGDAAAAAWAHTGAPAPATGLNEEEEGESGNAAAASSSARARRSGGPYDAMARATSISNRRQGSGGGSAEIAAGGGRARGASSALESALSLVSTAVVKTKNAIAGAVGGGGGSGGGGGAAAAAQPALRSQTSIASSGGSVRGGTAGGGGSGSNGTSRGVEMSSLGGPAEGAPARRGNSAGGAAAAGVAEGSEHALLHGDGAVHAEPQHGLHDEAGSYPAAQQRLSPSRGPPTHVPAWETFGSSSNGSGGGVGGSSLSAHATAPAPVFSYGGSGSILSRPSRALTANTFVDTSAGAAAATSAAAVSQQPLSASSAAATPPGTAVSTAEPPHGPSRIDPDAELDMAIGDTVAPYERHQQQQQQQQHATLRPAAPRPPAAVAAMTPVAEEEGSAQQASPTPSTAVAPAASSAAVSPDSGVVSAAAAAGGHKGSVAGPAAAAAATQQQQLPSSRDSAHSGGRDSATSRPTTRHPTAPLHHSPLVPEDARSGGGGDTFSLPHGSSDPKPRRYSGGHHQPLPPHPVTHPHGHAGSSGGASAGVQVPRLGRSLERAHAGGGAGVAGAGTQHAGADASDAAATASETESAAGAAAGAETAGLPPHDRKSSEAAFHDRIVASLSRLHRHHSHSRSGSPSGGGGGGGGAGALGGWVSPRGGVVDGAPGAGVSDGGGGLGGGAHLSSISAAMGRMLKDAILAGIRTNIPAEELQEVAEAAAAAFGAARPTPAAGAAAGAGAARGGGSLTPQPQSSTSLYGEGFGSTTAAAAGSGGSVGRAATHVDPHAAAAAASALRASSTTPPPAQVSAGGGGGGPLGGGAAVPSGSAGADQSVPYTQSATQPPPQPLPLLSPRAELASSGRYIGRDSAAAALAAAAPPTPPPKVYPKLRLSHVAACLDPALNLDPEKAFALFDSNADGVVERTEFLEAVGNIYSDLRALKASLNGHQSVSTAAASVMDVIFWLLLGVFVLYIFEVPVVQVYVPLGTVLVSASFAIGASLSNVVSSLIFVLVTRPYEVGDRVTASGVFAGEETLIVKKIDVLTTTFLRIVNKDLIVPNHQLLQMNIENFKRSPTAVMKIEVPVSMATTAAQLELLRRRINAYLESQPLAWKPACIIRAGRITEASITLTVWLSSHYLWQDAPRLFRANFMFHMALLSALRELSIKFRAPDQSLRIDGAVSTLMQQQQQQEKLQHTSPLLRHGSALLPYAAMHGGGSSSGGGGPGGVSSARQSQTQSGYHSGGGGGGDVEPHHERGHSRGGSGGGGGGGAVFGEGLPAAMPATSTTTAAAAAAGAGGGGVVVDERVLAALLGMIKQQQQASAVEKA